MFAAIPLVVLALLVTSSARPHVAPDDLVARALPRRWYHPPSHPVHRLFRRANSLATPGSPEWTAQYPPQFRPPLTEAAIPPAWLAALTAAEQAGKIPNISVSVPVTGATPAYPGGGNPGGPEICSSSSQCRGEGDIWDAPAGHIGIGFDDGPTYGSAKLYQFLQEQNQSATHFMIGVNILSNLGLFNEAYSTLQNDIAVHTWTHPYMTTQNNTQVVAQIGWTIQIIHDLTGGRIPRYWRPPYGDSDNRVRAIVREVFNMTQIDWNHDSADWNIEAGTTTELKVGASISAWLAGPKSPGLIVLEHELTNDTAQAFIATYAGIKSNNWVAVSVVDLFEGSWLNADDNEGPVQSMDIAGSMSPSTTSASSAASSTATAKQTQGSGSSNNNNNGKTSGARHLAPSSLLAFASLALVLL